MTSPIVPSARALVLLALFAPFAVVIAATVPGAWMIAPAAALAFVAMSVADGLLAPRLRDLQLRAPSDAEIGQPIPLTVLAEFIGSAPRRAPEAAVGFDPRLGARGTAGFALTIAGDPGVRSGEAAIVPVRRGTGSVTELWLRWPGPLGLAHRQAHRRFDHAVRVWPDLSPVRSPTLQAFLRDAQFGLVARRVRGEGSQFEALSEYQAGMDRRRIDWKASARHTRLYARENESERDNQVVLAFDCGHAMCEPVDGLPRIDRAVSAALTAAYVALKGGDRVALYGFADRPQLMTPFATDSREFHRVQTAAAGLDYASAEPNFTLALATLAARLRRRSLIVLFSDFADTTSAELMVESVERLVRRHLVIFATLADTELAELTDAPPDSLRALATAVAADGLARQRAVVLQRLRHLGVDVIEAPWQAIGYRLIDRYLAAKRAEAIG
ncbi:MAG: DUF58 domain-containing protein [Sphingomonadales bacterium 32-68-7]|nr:MAG: DUF58 domain-containing protein [Sphingomonadales bacterium 12-68-11]OYX09935.1 MAG: DUF58 domain-containing protein [Sphingomonadales bacterium 32-68-7]